MSAVLLPQGKQQYFTAVGDPLVGGKVFTYDTGTTTPRTTWADAAQSAPNANPIILDARGEAPIFWSGAYRVVVQDSLGNAIWTMDGVSDLSYGAGLRLDLASFTDGAKGAALVGFGPAVSYSANSIGSFVQTIYKRTAGEIAAGVTPVNFGNLPGQLLRQANNTTPGTTDMATAFQAAIDGASAQAPNVYFSDACAVSKPLLIRATTQQGASLIGASKPVALIEPNAVDIKQAPQNINCLIFNQNNNPHLQLLNLRFASVAAFTGIVLYCKEGGGGDGSGQCLFSPIIRDLFVDLSSTNSGFLTGALQNGFVESNTFESMKGVFTIEGIGHQDVHYTDNSLFNCFDHFINQVADTNGSQIVTVSGLHAYSHNRGFLFDVKNWDGCNVEDVILEPAVGNLGTVGIGKFTDCLNLTLSNLISRVRAGVPAGETILEFAGAVATSAKISGAYLTGNRAVKISATGAVTIEFDNCDFSTAGVHCFDTTGAVTSGTIITRNCKFNNAQIHGFVNTAGVGYNWYSYGDEFINAGLGGNAASRNIAISSSAEVILTSPKIGRTNGGAAAAFFIEAGGAGTVKIIHPTFVGTPPTGIKTGAQEVQIVYKPGFGADIASAATITIPNEGDMFNVTGTTNITSISAGNMKGRRVTLIFAGALTLTDGSNLKLAGNFVTTADDAIEVVCDGTNWFQASPGSVN